MIYLKTLSTFPKYFREQFGQRILLKCESIKFRLQAPIDGERELLCQVEPYYTYLALFDTKHGKKISENFYFDLNHNAVKDIMIGETNFGLSYGDSEIEPKLNLKNLSDEWFKNKKQVMPFILHTFVFFIFATISMFIFRQYYPSIIRMRIYF